MGGLPTNPKMVTHQNEVYQRLGIWHKTNTRWQLPWMVTYHSLGGHPPTLGWSPIRWKCPSNLKFGNYTLLTKLTPGDICHGWSPMIPRRVTCQSKIGHPPTQGWLPRLALPGPIWPGLTPFGLGCPCFAHLVLFGPVWPRLAPSAPLGPIWPHLTTFDHVLPCLTLFDPIWLYLPLFVPVWYPFNSV